MLFSTKKLFPITKATSTILQVCPKTVPLTLRQTSRVELEKVTQLEFWVVPKLAPYSTETQILPSPHALLFAQPQARTSSEVKGTVTTVGRTFFGFISRVRSRDTIRKKYIGAEKVKKDSKDTIPLLSLASNGNIFN